MEKYKYTLVCQDRKTEEFFSFGINNIGAIWFDSILVDTYHFINKRDFKIIEMFEN